MTLLYFTFKIWAFFSDLLWGVYGYFLELHAQLSVPLCLQVNEVEKRWKRGVCLKSEQDFCFTVLGSLLDGEAGLYTREKL